MKVWTSLFALALTIEHYEVSGAIRIRKGSSTKRKGERGLDGISSIGIRKSKQNQGCNGCECEENGDTSRYTYSSAIWDGTGDGRDSDLNVYFNKFNITNHFEDYQRLLPLRADGYPISRHKDVVVMLKEDSTGISVVDDLNDYEIRFNIVDLIEKVGGLPDHPSRNKDAKYWDKLNEVIDMQLKPDNARADSELVDKIRLPLRWKDYTVHDVAEAVYDEYPGRHQAEFIDDLVKGQYGAIEFDYTIIPRRSANDFLRGIVMLADCHMRTTALVGTHIFGAKWYAGRALPEETAWKIKTGEINYDAVPPLIHSKIAKMNLKSAESFTRYKEGSSRHPSWPAMHSGAGNLSFWLQIVMNLTPRQLCEAKRVDYAVGFAKVVAGVNFSDDIIAGLNMGQVAISKVLPDFFANKFGSNIDAVRTKVAKKGFDWNEYDSLESCPLPG